MIIVVVVLVVVVTTIPINNYDRPKPTGECEMF
jgi:hypothetical protein